MYTFELWLFQSLSFINSPSSASQIPLLSISCVLPFVWLFSPPRHPPCHSHFQSIQNCQMHIFYAMALNIPLLWMNAFHESPFPTELERNPGLSIQTSVFCGPSFWLYLPPLSSQPPITEILTVFQRHPMNFHLCDFLKLICLPEIFSPLQ